MTAPLRILVSGVIVWSAFAAPLNAQSLLDRPPNLSGGWVTTPGTIQFNFLHRFVRSDPPIRKISNYPTFLVATSFLRRTMVGFNYSTNSTLAAQYPNEWEFFGRVLPVSQDAGAPLDIAGQVGYNLAARGADGELTLARRFGPVRLIAVGRALKNPDSTTSKLQFAVGGGMSLKLTHHLALAGDVASLAKRNAALGEKVAWSTGIQLALPNTPHTFSIQAANTNTATLQGASRGGDKTRYGFEFTIPFTLARYFGHKQKPAPSGEVPVGAGGLFQNGMHNVSYLAPNISVPVGTTIEWKNDDLLPHTVTADDGTFDSGLIDPGAVWRHNFDKPGTYTYHCTPHPFMKGTVVVH